MMIENSLMCWLSCFWPSCSLRLALDAIYNVIMDKSPCWHCNLSTWYISVSCYTGCDRGGRPSHALQERIGKNTHCWWCHFALVVDGWKCQFNWKNTQTRIITWWQSEKQSIQTDIYMVWGTDITIGYEVLFYFVPIIIVAFSLLSNFFRVVHVFLSFW